MEAWGLQSAFDSESAPMVRPEGMARPALSIISNTGVVEVDSSSGPLRLREKSLFRRIRHWWEGYTLVHYHLKNCS